ncbi:hypothetical protein Tco_0217049 [Tanacetum coccineum]
MSSSTVTYTSVYTGSEPGRVFWGADEDPSDGGPPRVIVYGYDGLPMQPIAPPSPDYVPGPEHPPSPDYVPGPEHPPSPVDVPYVPEPEYPKYLAPSDVEVPLEDQPLPVDASPTALSPGYVADFDPDLKRIVVIWVGVIPGNFQNFKLLFYPLTFWFRLDFLTFDLLRSHKNDYRVAGKFLKRI